MPLPVPEKGEYIEVDFRTDPQEGQVDHQDPAYLMDRRSALAINAALATNRPLLVRGEPGIGKTQLARAAAHRLKRAFIRHTVSGRTETNELMWSIDHVSRLAEAQIANTPDPKGRTAQERVALKNFVRPGPLWQAFDRRHAETPTASARERAARPADPRGVVLLIDEIDKADAAIPNALLEALGRRRFEVPEIGWVEHAPDAPAPLVVFTTNNERFMPDAFLRRCWVLELILPDQTEDRRRRAIGSADTTVRRALRDALEIRGRAHLGDRLPDAVYQAASELIADARLAHHARDEYRPGVGEYIELLKAVRGAQNPEALLADLAQFVLNKQGLR